jgi:EAL domain-containing protein (putative c-di-GMP-specific phosphodiesterase class I)
MVEEVGRTTGIDPASVVLDVTENALLERVQSPRETLDRLSGLGLKLNLDDFGTGYSSLSYLKRFPLSGLKIDRALVSAIGGRNGDAAIVDAILQMARPLDLHVVAEGIESEEQLETLRRLGCTLGQGYLFSRPVDAAGASALLESGKI